MSAVIQTLLHKGPGKKAQRDAQDEAALAHTGYLARKAKDATRKPRALCYCPGLCRRIWTGACAERQRNMRLVEVIESQCKGCARHKEAN